MRRMFSNEEISQKVGVPVEEIETWNFVHCHEHCDLGKVKGIDIGIVDFIRKLWSHGIRTYSSCQGGPVEWTLTPQQKIDWLERPNVHYFLDDNSNPIEFAHVDIRTTDLEKALPLLVPFSGIIELENNRRKYITVFWKPQWYK